MKHTKHKAFTLVELIVVVTILAILATIGFVSYSSYLTGVRDTNRISQLSSISDGLNLYSTKNSLPLPEDSVEILVGTDNVIAYQGYAGSNTLETIDFTKGGQDPKDDSYFSYYLTKDRNHFQLMAFLEEADSLAFVPSPGRGGLGRGIVHAADYSDRYPTVMGRKLGILTDESNSPIQEVITGQIDLVTDNTTDYVAYITNSTTLTGSTAGISDLESLENIANVGGTISESCNNLLDRKPGVQNIDGAYMINPSGTSPELIYCDMTTDGGGWTFFQFIDETTKNTSFFETENGVYKSDRSDTGEAYGLSSDIFSHTEMMISINDPDPTVTEGLGLAFFKYTEGHNGFNNGPFPCELTSDDYEFKISASGSYSPAITSPSCSTGYWYTYGDATYLVLLYSNNSTYPGVYRGSELGGGNSGWGQSGWFYLR